MRVKDLTLPEVDRLCSRYDANGCRACPFREKVHPYGKVTYCGLFDDLNAKVKVEF